MIEVEAMRESPRAHFIYIVLFANIGFILFLLPLWNLWSAKYYVFPLPKKEDPFLNIYPIKQPR
jgi:hypothetical protein